MFDLCGDVGDLIPSKCVESWTSQDIKPPKRQATLLDFEEDVVRPGKGWLNSLNSLSCPLLPHPQQTWPWTPRQPTLASSCPRTRRACDGNTCCRSRPTAPSASTPIPACWVAKPSPLAATTGWWTWQKGSTAPSGSAESLCRGRDPSVLIPKEGSGPCSNGDSRTEPSPPLQPSWTCHGSPERSASL